MFRCRRACNRDAARPAAFNLSLCALEQDMSFAGLPPYKPGEVRKITGPGNELVKIFTGLRQKKYRAQTDLFVTEGARALIEALELGLIPLAVAYHTASGGEPYVKRIKTAVQKSGGLLLEVND